MKTIEITDILDTLVSMSSLTEALRLQTATLLGLQTRLWLKNGDLRECEKRMTAAETFAAEHGFDLLAKASHELAKDFNSLQAENSIRPDPKLTEELGARIKYFNKALVDSLSSRKLLALTSAERLLIESDVGPFGDKVSVAFPQTTEDLAEATKCMAFHRYTAVVFHLMRALEAAAQIVADKIGVTIRDQSGKGLPWGVIADNMRPVIDRMPKGSEEQARWYRVQESLVVVNRAWRVPTAHPKQTYTEEEANNVFNATRGFMQELAALV